MKLAPRVLIAALAAGCAAPLLGAMSGAEHDSALALLSGDRPSAAPSRTADSALSGTPLWEDFVGRLTDPYADVSTAREDWWGGLPSADLLRAATPSGASSARDGVQGRASRWRGIMNAIAARMPDPDKGSMLMTGVLCAWLIARRRWRNASRTGRF